MNARAKHHDPLDENPAPWLRAFESWEFVHDADGPCDAFADGLCSVCAAAVAEHCESPSFATLPMFLPGLATLRDEPF